MQLSTLIYIAIGLTVGILIARAKMKDRSSAAPSGLRMPDREFPWQWRKILESKVEFYKKLSRDDRTKFENKVHLFLLNVQIVGVGTSITHEDRVLVAAGAIIPIFKFPHWYYYHLYEVQLFPDKFPIKNSEQMANGLVGWGELDGKLLLSKKHLHEGFDITDDGSNVAIHEFIHTLDKEDGEVDGLIERIMKEGNSAPWFDLMYKKMDQIQSGESTIRDYGAASEVEFLAVVSEYFFEKPEEMKKDHPGLYNALNSFFNPPTYEEKFKYTTKYDRCPCGSGREFRRCCMKNARMGY